MLTLVCEADVDVVLTKGSQIKSVEVAGDDVVFTVEQGGKVSSLTVDGKNGEINVESGAVVPSPTGDGTATVVITGNTGTGTSSGGSSGGSSGDSSPRRYDIAVDTAEGGSVTADKEKASRGTTVTLTVTPEEGHVLRSLSAVKEVGTALAIQPAQEERCV